MTAKERGMMAMNRSQAYGFYKIVGKIFTLVGIIFCMVGGVGYAGQTAAKRTMSSVQAVVIARYPGGTEAEYFVDGLAYRTILNYSSDFLHEGDKITIYYQPGDPEKTKFADPVIFPVFLSMGLIVLVIGILAGRRYAKMNKRRQCLMRNGQKLYADIVRIDGDYRYERGCTYARKLICQYLSPEGEAFAFVSEPIWMDIGENLIGSQVPVYVERGNYGNYYVDVSFLAPGLEIYIH